MRRRQSLVRPKTEDVCMCVCFVVVVGIDRGDRLTNKKDASLSAVEQQ